MSVSPERNEKSNLVQFPKSSKWMEKVVRFYDNGHEDFSLVCSIARSTAQSVAFPRDNSIFALIENMTYLERDPFWRDYAICEIEKVCEGTYFCDPQGDSTHLADIILFPNK